MGKADDTLKQKRRTTQAFLGRMLATKAIRKRRSRQWHHSYSAEGRWHSTDRPDLTKRNALLAALDGREITRMDGTKQTLHLANTLSWCSRRCVRSAGMACPVKHRTDAAGWQGTVDLLEFNVPGTIVPGALGTLMVLLGVFALDLLPIRFTALLLVAAGVLITLEAKFGGHGVLATAGILCLTFGTLTLVAAPIPELRINPWVAIAVSLAFGELRSSCASGDAGSAAEGAPGCRCSCGQRSIGH
jgi:membrane-bound serine protease (ClpP class)